MSVGPRRCRASRAGGPVRRYDGTVHYSPECEGGGGETLGLTSVKIRPARRKEGRKEWTSTMLRKRKQNIPKRSENPEDEEGNTQTKGEVLFITL